MSDLADFLRVAWGVVVFALLCLLFYVLDRHDPYR